MHKMTYCYDLLPELEGLLMFRLRQIRLKDLKRLKDFNFARECFFTLKRQVLADLISDDVLHKRNAYIIESIEDSEDGEVRAGEIIATFIFEKNSSCDFCLYFTCTENISSFMERQKIELKLLFYMLLRRLSDTESFPYFISTALEDGYVGTEFLTYLGFENKGRRYIPDKDRYISEFSLNFLALASRSIGIFSLPDAYFIFHTVNCCNLDELLIANLFCSKDYLFSRAERKIFLPDETGKYLIYDLCDFYPEFKYLDLIKDGVFYKQSDLDSLTGIERKIDDSGSYKQVTNKKSEAYIGNMPLLIESNFIRYGEKITCPLYRVLLAELGLLGKGARAIQSETSILNIDFALNKNIGRDTLSYVRNINSKMFDQTMEVDLETKANPKEKVYVALNEYINNKNKDFNFYYLVEGSDFQIKVSLALLQIPYGQACSYAEIAKKVEGEKGSKAYLNYSRAVGQACGMNSLPIFIPCHRVIGKDGSITGFTSGIRIKERLLANETLSNLRRKEID